MGLTDEFNRAREWVKDLSFDVDDKFHNFEVRSCPAAASPRHRSPDTTSDHNPCTRRAPVRVPPLWKRPDVPRQGGGPRGPSPAGIRHGPSRLQVGEVPLILALAAIRSPIELHQPASTKGDRRRRQPGTDQRRRSRVRLLSRRGNFVLIRVPAEHCSSSSSTFLSLLVTQSTGRRPRRCFFVASLLRAVRASADPTDRSWTLSGVRRRRTD